MGINYGHYLMKVKLMNIAKYVFVHQLYEQAKYDEEKCSLSSTSKEETIQNSVRIIAGYTP